MAVEAGRRERKRETERNISHTHTVHSTRTAYTDNKAETMLWILWWTIKCMASPTVWWHTSALLFMISTAAYIIPALLMSIVPRIQGMAIHANLKKRYNATWAVVTGASSGIGKAMAHKLASQGVSVILVAVKDELLSKTEEEFKRQFPRIQIRSVGVDLGSRDDGKTGYMETIASATKDVVPTLIFCNAGYVLTGFFWETPIEKLMANVECNACSCVKIAHHFVRRMVDAKKQGAVVITSSAAAAMPSPFTVLYASTKAFLSSFGASLAAEVKSKGIDVCVVHPSPIASRFYDNTHKIDMLDFFKLFSVAPETLPDFIFASVGRTVWRDIGGVAVFFRLMMKVVDYNFMATLLANIAHMMPDYKRHAK